MGILKQPTWWEDASEASPPAQWEAGAYPVTVDAAPPERGEFTGTIKFPLGTPIELSATSTPGVPGDSYFDNVVLLLHMEGTNGGHVFTDSSSYARAMEAIAGASTSTTQKLFGSTSYNVNASTLVVTPASPELQLADHDFVIEMAVFLNSSGAGSGGLIFVLPNPAAPTPCRIGYDSGFTVNVKGTDAADATVYDISTLAPLSADTWHRLAIQRSGTTFTLFLDGVVQGTDISAATLVDFTYEPSLSRGMQIGGLFGSIYLDGYIDELRMTVGVSRYAGNYTPDVIAFYNQIDVPPVPGAIPGGFVEDTTYYVVPSGDVNPLIFALAATVGGVPIVATDAGSNVVATDGRYTFISADTQISYSGDIAIPATLTLTGTVRLAYQTIVHASAGTLQFEYNLGAGAVDVNLTNTDGAVGILSVCLDGATQFVWGLKSGTTGATVAFQEGPGDTTYGNGGVNFNCSCPDENDFQTLAQLRRRMMVRLGFASTADNPPPGMADLLTDFLQSAQRNLFKKYPARFTRRFFKWDMTQGTRFYGVKGNTDDTYRNLRADFTKGVEWSGIQDSKGTWTPIYEGIQPELYTMVTQLGRPVRYELRECIEVFPAPDGPYSLWLKAHIGLQAFTADGDETTIDSEVVFLHALAVAKAHYGQADTNTVQAMALAYLGELTAGTHLNKRYIPGAHPQMPIVKPALIQFQDGS